MNLLQIARSILDNIGNRKKPQAAMPPELATGDSRLGGEIPLDLIQPSANFGAPMQAEADPLDEFLAQARRQREEAAANRGAAESAYQSNLRTLEEPRNVAPLQSSPQIDPVEGILGSVAGLLLPSGSVSQQRAIATPTELARARQAELQKRYDSRYEDRQKTAGMEAQRNAGMVQVYLDSESAAMRVEQMVQSGRMKTQASQLLQAIKANGQIVKQIADLQGRGQLTESTLGMLIGQMTGDSASAMQMAPELMAKMVADPSFRMQLDQAKFEQKAESDAVKEGETQRSNQRKIAIDPNATYEMRLNAMMSLSDLGDPLFAGMSLEQMQTSAANKGAITQNVEAKTDLAQQQTETEKERTKKVRNEVQAVLAHTSLTNEQRKLLEKRVAHFDEDFKTRVAERSARIAKLTVEGGTPAQARQAFSAYASVVQKQIDRLEDQKADVLGDFTDEEQDRLDALYAELDRVSGALEGVAFPEEPAPVQGPIGGRAQGGGRRAKTNQGSGRRAKGGKSSKGFSKTIQVKGIGNVTIEEEK